jgi:CheY-like chemotaxis protein
VIDDERSVLGGMKALLGGWGCIVHVAASGAQAIEVLRDLPRAPDIVCAKFVPRNFRRGLATRAGILATHWKSDILVRSGWDRFGTNEKGRRWRTSALI